MDMRLSVHQKHLGLAFIYLVLFFNFFYALFPRHLDFAFWYWGGMVYGIVSDNVSMNDIFLGNNVIKLIIIKICNISFESVNTLPLMLLQITTIFICIFNRLSNSFHITLLLAFSVFLPVRYPGEFILYTHNSGFVLFLSILLLLIIYSDTGIDRIPVSIIMIICIISLNYISYKITFITIFFILSLTLFWKIGKLFDLCLNKEMMNFALVALISIVYVGFFNNFIYERFVPVARIASEAMDLGYTKIFDSILTDNSNYLSKYYIEGTSSILAIIRLLLLYMSLLLCGLVFYSKIKNRSKFLSIELTFIALIFASICLLIVYNIIGLLEMTYLTYSCFIGYAILQRIGTSRIKVAANICLIALFIVSIIYASEIHSKDLFFGHVDHNDANYFLPTISWNLDHFSNDSISSTDVFSYGKFTNIAMKKGNNMRNFELIPIDDMLFLLEQNNTLNTNVKVKKMYIINYKLKYFCLSNWYNFKSWIKYKRNLEENEYIDNIYTSGYIDIYPKRI
jgi:hypothetical protein